MRSLLIQVALGSILIVSSCSTSTYSGRYVRWNTYGIDDYRKFPAYHYQASENPFVFHKTTLIELDTLMVPVAEGRRKILLDVLKDSKTTAFLVIKNDTILYEKYLNEYSRDSMNTSFSVAKSITSLIVGKAIDQGLIEGTDAAISRYIPELEKVDSRYSEVKISHLLNMKSGIQFNDHDLIWGDKPKAYYHPQLRERIMEIPVKNNPGKVFKYNSYNPIFLGVILENVSGMSPAAYFEKFFWDGMGMEYSGSWSLDSEESGMTKMESGLNLRARDFAKFGRLMLKKGNWDGAQLISSEWMEGHFEIDERHKVDGFGEEIFYKNFWWIYSKDGSEADIISGWGHLGQYLYVFPKSNTIIVRMGKDNDGVKSWGKLFREINTSIAE